MWTTPPGWRWMRRKRLPAVFACAGIALFALLVGLEIAAEGTGHSIDPTDQMNYNTYALRNDSSSRLYFHLCRDVKCTQLDSHFDWVALQTGAVDDEQVYWGTTTPSAFAVAAIPGATGTWRCLVVDAAKKAPAKVDLPLSSAGNCAS